MQLPIQFDSASTRKRVLLLLTTSAVWLAFFARQYSGKGWEDKLASVAIAFAGVLVFSGLAYATSLLLSGPAPRGAGKESIAFDKALPIICAVLIGVSGLSLFSDARTLTTQHNVMTAAGGVVECTATEYIPSADE